MKVISITSRQLRKLPELQLSSKIINVEAKLYLYNYKNSYLRLRALMKIYYNQEIDNITDKIRVISQLISSFEGIDIPELVLPSALVSINGNVGGYLMPFIEDNINLALILKNPKINLKTKLEFLQKILNLLFKIKNIKELQDKFFLGDIHEANFIFDINDQMVKTVDLDSSYFIGGPIPVSKFTTFNAKLFENPKYKIDEETNKLIPSENATSLCFLYMLLNTLSEEESYKWSINEYYQYISFLGQQGFPKDLLELLTNIYTPGSIDIYDPSLLDGINVSKDYSFKRARLLK